jgi:hypothetical protein
VATTFASWTWLTAASHVDQQPWSWSATLALAIRITDDMMTLEIDNRVVATVRFSGHASADGNGAWIVDHPARLLTCDQAITVMTVAEPGKSGYLDSHPLAAALRAELG